MLTETLHVHFPTFYNVKRRPLPNYIKTFLHVTVMLVLLCGVYKGKYSNYIIRHIAVLSDFLLVVSTGFKLLLEMSFESEYLS